MSVNNYAWWLYIFKDKRDERKRVDAKGVDL